MQILKPIKVGQAPNDQTGDTLRDAMVVVNENFTKTRSGVDAVEVAVAAAQRRAAVSYTHLTLPTILLV